MLSITKEEFLEIYKGLPICESVDLFYSTPKTDAEIKNIYLPSKMWRLNNVYNIVDKMGKKVRFRMNKSQHRAYATALRHPRVIILKSRQQGISTLWLVSFFDDAVTKPNLSIGLMAQGQDEAETLLERTKTLWDSLDHNVKFHLAVDIKKDNTKEFSLTNGSSIFIRTSFRSATLQRLHISEMGKIANKYPEKAKETKTGTLQALAQGNTGIVESTAEGDNMFKEMWDNAVSYSGSITPKDFMPLFLSWVDDPDCVVERDQQITYKHEKYFKEVEAQLGIKLTRQQKNFWVTQWRELGDSIYQEYPSTPLEAFTANKSGNYYAHLWFVWVQGYKREIPNLYDPNLQVQVAIDLGMNDTNVIGAFQTYQEEFRIFDEYADSGQDIKFYCDWMKERPWFENLTHVILPHDSEVKEMTSGKKRIDVFEEELKYHKDGRETGITITQLEKTSSVNDDIEQVRQMIKWLWIDPMCEYVKSCFLNYKKQWDDKRNRFRDKPEHDEYSNGADMVRYIVKGAWRGTRMKKPPRSDSASRRVARERGFDV